MNRKSKIVRLLLGDAFHIPESAYKQLSKDFGISIDKLKEGQIIYEWGTSYKVSFALIIKLELRDNSHIVLSLKHIKFNKEIK